MVDTRDLKSLAGNSIPVRVRSPAPSWSANFDDTAPSAVSSRLSGLFQLGKLFIFPLMTTSVFERLTGLEPPFNGISEFICELLDVVSER